MALQYELRALAHSYSVKLKQKMSIRMEEMKTDNQEHFLVYRVLGITNQEGRMIDMYQNKGRFLYKYVGSFLEEATKLCFKHKFPNSGAVQIPNTRSPRPKTFEIDCLVDSNAIEIKWRDATTDGDHINKEHCRIQSIVDNGYKPIRVMFYYPNRVQAQRVQETLETLYKGVNGEYYWGNNAWEYVRQQSNWDLKALLEEMAAENTYE